MIVYPMTEEDAPEVEGLEQQLFSDPWTLDNILGGMDERIGYCLAARNERGVQGYLIARLVGDEGELLRIGTDRNLQNRGIAGELLDRMIEDNPEIRIWRLDVRAGNAAAIHLYEKAGFRTVTENPGFYRDPTEAGLLMAREVC